MNSIERGAASELMVAADLILKGYEVHRNLLRTGFDCVVICKETGRCFTVEVKQRAYSGYSLNEVLMCPDILASVDPQGNIKYFPENWEEEIKSPREKRKWVLRNRAYIEKQKWLEGGK